MIELYGDGTGNPEASDPVTVVYDPTGYVLYFGDSENDGIFAGAADGSGLTELYSADNVRDIAIDAANNFIYWVDLDNIWRGNLDGTGVASTIYDDMGGNLRAIEMDLATNRLFLGEFNVPGLDDVIWTVNADSSSGSQTVIHSGDFGGIRGLTLESSSVVPEPSTYILFLTGLAALGIVKYRRK